MTSSMLAGERRWASARRGGMTVLGKVAVPKPLNLPSQKLENHGLDPNVEIVPKGSLSWGSRPSSSTSNPWGSSAVSPNSDGNTVSPRHPSNRPTSGGGLSRPSTAGSEKVHEPSANTTTWGPNSRPSSASGVLTSNQSSLTSTRPLSAETRPGSSHLSRFAEPLFDNSMAWGPNGSTADKLSIPSKANDFSLSSGDFPTLGSEKDNTSKINESHDHGSHVRPGSASGRSAPTKERNEMSQDPRGGSGNVETWTRDGPPHMEEKWHGDPHQYVNPNVPPQHFDAWRGPPMNGPGPWYRGPPPPAGPPYPPVPHGGYPMEPFPYYRPQIPPPLANTQPGPPPPRGHHPRNGDFYRPQMPDAFIRPGMPMRPGFYPGPVPYDGYFGPPMGYNPNDRDNPYMGLPPGPPVYNMCPPQNPSEFNDAHFRGRGFVPEQMDSLPPEETRGPYKVLRKRENERNADVDEGSWEQQTSTGNTLVIEKNDHSNPNLNTNPNSRPLFHKNDRSTDTRRNTFNDNSSSRMLVNQGHPSDSKTSNESWGKKSEIMTPFPEVPQEIPPNPKDSSLIQKIEGLNAKVRASEEPKNNNPTLTFGSISTTGDLAPPRDINVLKADNNNNTSKSTTSSGSQISRQPHHGVRKVRSNNQETDGWRKKPQVPGSEVADQNSGENPEVKNTGEGLAPVVDPNDGQAQRARMRELAKQRAIQLQKEEEERIREQKAKALAKLEELNRRTLAADGTTQTTEGTAASVVGQEENQKETAPEETFTTKHEAMSSDLDTKVQPAVQVSEPSQQEPDQTLVPKQPELESKTVAQPKKRNNKSSKNKPKVEEASSSEIRKPESPDNLEQVTSVPSIQNKPQHSRRTQRNPQPGNRPADRFHGNDGAVWAPVRANKEDRRDENSQKTIHDDVALPGKNDNSAQANLKNRRAEMERYVPKPVAKEQLAQQVTGQPSSPPRKSAPEDINNGEKSGSEPVVPVQTKSQSKKNHQKAGSQIETPETNVVAHEWDPSDGWFMPEYPPPAEVPLVVKDEGGGKGKRAAYKGGGGGGQRSTVKHHEAESGAEVTTDRERPVSSKENRSSQWQPKPRGWSGGGPEVKRDQANDGRRYNEEQHEGRRERKPTSSRGGRIHSPNNMEDETQQYEQQHSSSGFRKYGGGGQNNRGGGGGGQGGDNRRQNNNNINRERPRQNLHYEYQPVGSNNTSNNNSNTNKSGNVDGGADGGGRYKERGSSQTRRGGGNFYGRQ